MNNIHQGMNDIHHGGKKKIRVLVPTGTVPLAHKELLSHHEEYKGLVYDIWNEIKPLLEDKYEFEEHFVEQTVDFNYTEQVNQIGEGKYDIGINGYSITSKRLEEVIFSQPVFVERNAILHYPRNSYWNSIFMLITDSFIKPFFIILVIAIIIGWILNEIEPGNWTSKLIPKKFYLRKTILVLISIIFGQGGLLESKTTHTPRGVVLILLTLFISTVFFLYLQAIITDKVININKNYNLTASTIGTIPYLSAKGDAIKSQFNKLNMNVKVVDYDGEELIKYYENNKDEYGGIIMPSVGANYYHTLHPNLIVSDRTFGYVPVQFAINKDTIPFIDHVNEALASLHRKKNIINICKAYSEYQNPDLCNI